MKSCRTNPRVISYHFNRSIMSYYPLNYCSREECDLELEILDGQLPDDLKGHLFIAAPCGSVNHEWPAPRHWPDGKVCQEHGAPLLNGDGMVYRFDFSGDGSVRLKNRILKTPDYHADQATRYGSRWYEQGLHFENLGLTRTHQDLGTRNQLNTAFNLLRPQKDQPALLSANFDAGRPWLVDPVELKTITAIGKQQEWLQALPDEMEQVFPLIYSTAHPSFDPYSGEFYTVSYQKSISNLIFGNRLERKVMLSGKFLDEELQKFTAWISGHKLSMLDIGNAIRSFIPWLNQKHTENHKREFSDHYQLQNSSLANSELRLMRWQGEKLNSWRVIDSEEALPVSLGQTMHQTCITEEYIILCDCTLKFSMDLMQSLPFGDHDFWNNFLRQLTTSKIQPTTPLYLINRNDIIDEAEEVKARRLELPRETIHLAADYRNPQGKITIHASHNSAACGAEWLRPYDKRAVDGQPLPADRLGMMCAGALDIGSLGKHVIDAGSGKINSSEYLSRQGFSGGEAKAIGAAHTWGLGLFAHHNMYQADDVEDEIRHIYHHFYGLNKDDLSDFIYQLYKDYNSDHRQIDSEQMLEYYRQGIPECLARQNTRSMALEDWYLFPKGSIMRSFDFMPKTGKAGENTDPQMHGYLVCLCMEPAPGNSGEQPAYRRLLQIFDAANLKAGPLCKLAHKDLKWGFTLHSCSTTEIEPSNTSYRVDVKADCEWVISKFPRQEKQKEMRDFLSKEVYPHYENPA